MVKSSRWKVELFIHYFEDQICKVCDEQIGTSSFIILRLLGREVQRVRLKLLVHV